MPDRQDALGLMGREIHLEPLLLRRAGAALPDVGTVRVEHDDVPRSEQGTEIEAVVALARLACASPEIAEIPCRSGRLVLVISRRRVRPRLVPTPGRVVAICELDGRSGLVGIVACGENRSVGELVEESRRLPVRL